MKTAGILLAAGRSLRFGSADKLLAEFRGKPLVLHSASALKALAPDVLVAVASSKDVADLLPEFELSAPPRLATEQCDSLRAGISVAKSRGAKRALIVLGDMPFVDVHLMRSVIDLCTDERPSAATDGIRLAPPACFPAASFSALQSLSGKRGAHSLLSDLPPTAMVRTDPKFLSDIDTVGDLKDLSQEKG